MLSAFEFTGGIISANIVAEHLEEHLSWRVYQLSEEETAHFLTVCAELMNQKVMTFQKVKTHILAIKECKDHAGNSD